MNEVWQRAQGLGRDYGGRAAGVLLTLAVGWLVLRFLLGPLQRGLARARADPSVSSFLVNSVRLVVLLAVLLAVLQQVGVETASLLTLLGAAGLSVALSLRDSLANYAAGLQLLTFRLVRVDDLIEVGDVRGRVVALHAFHVLLDTADNQRVIVPNKLLTGGPLRNLSALPTRRIAWTLPVPAGADLAVLKEALCRRLRADARVLAEPAPESHVQEWGEQKHILAVTAWTTTEQAQAVQQDLLEELGRALEAALPRPDGAGGPGEGSAARVQQRPGPTNEP